MTMLSPGSVVGILGGGQLGRMLAIAAAQLGYRVAIYAPEADSVAAEVAAHHVAGSWEDRNALADFATACDIVTYEWENVPVAAARVVAAAGQLAPAAEVLTVAQDRVAEKAFAERLGLAVPAFAEVDSADTLAAAVARIGAPALLKTAHGGYDGKGQVRITHADSAAAAWTALGEVRAILEAQVDFLGEFSVIVARDAAGTIRTWDVPENRHEGGILTQSSLPAPAAWRDQIDRATAQARAIADALDHIGVLAVEFFATPDGPVFNELAPRVHNSGHWTIDGAVTSQFENHIRAICGLPLGDTATLALPVQMRNLIGDDVLRAADLLADPACRLHLYGKGAPQAGRKMGHATWVGGLPT